MVTVKRDGRRFYLEGTPYSARDVLRDAGCKWDAGKRCWWTGKQSTVDSVLAALAASENAPGSLDTVDLDARIVRGRAKYKGRSYYLLAERQDRTGAKLSFSDGSKQFWTKQGEPYEVVKFYQEPKSIRGLMAYAEKAKADKAAYGYVPQRGVDYCGYPCPVSGVRCTPDSPCHDCL
jgi:hypothetical protein